MQRKDEKLLLPPDLYSRNTVITQLVNIVFKNTGYRVLDVGGYEANLHSFFPENTDFTVMDLKPQPENLDPAVKYKQANAQKIPFSDNNFEIVVCTDVLEHVDKAFRAPVIRELLRVTKNYLFIGIPSANGTGLVNKAENYIREQFIQNAGVQHPFLLEHEQYGLPDEEKLENVFIKENVNFIKIKEGNLMNWYIQQLYSGVYQGLNTGLNTASFNKFFNENLFELGNLRSPAYRTIYCIAKTGQIDEQAVYEELLSIHKWNPEMFMQLLEKAFRDMRGLINERKELLEDLSSKNSERHLLFEELVQKFEKANIKLEEAEAFREYAQKQLDEKNKLLNETEEKVFKAREILQKHREIIIELRNFLAEKEKALNLLKEIVRQKDKLVEELDGKNEELTQKYESQTKFMSMLAAESQSKTTENDRLKEHIQQNEKQLAKKNNEIKAGKEKLSEAIIDLENHQRELRKVVNSRAWKTIMFYSKIKHAIFINPAKLIRRGLGILINLGPRVFWQRLLRKIKGATKRKGHNSADPYNEYIQQNELTSQKKKEAHKAIEKFDFKPVLSIIMPVYNVDEKWLKKAIDSVRGQWYTRWELCICDDGSDKAEVKDLLKSESGKDNRIKVIYKQKNSGIVKATNEALKLATGAYVGFLDNDDELTEDALYEVVKALQEHKYDMLYSDEDKLNADGNRCDPFFKPDWSPDLLLSMNYICHFTVYRRKIIQELNGLRDGFDGSQDYDLTLRFTEKAQNIRHLPKVLYHWRMLQGSAAAEVEAKPYAFDSAKKALQQAMKRRGIKADVSDGLWKGSYRVKRDIGSRPLVSIIIPFKDKLEVLKPCLNSIINKTSYDNYEIILVNNRSELLETSEYLRNLDTLGGKIRIYNHDQNFNFSAINNFAARQAKGEVLILLNNDTEIINPEWIESMLEHALRPEVGAVGAKLIYPNDMIQHAGVVIGVGGIANSAFMKQWKDDNGYFGLVNVVRNYSAVTGACLMVRKELYEKLGGLNENELAVTFNDVDFCLRLRELGYLVVYTPYAQVYHHESLSRGYEVSFDEIKYMERAHSGILKADPYYNINLSSERSDFSLKVQDLVKKD